MNDAQDSYQSLETQVRAVAGLLQAGRIKVARRAIDSLKGQGPDNGDIWALDGELALRERRPEAARAAVDRALALDPGLPERHIQRARCYLLTGDAEEALVSAELALACPLRRLDHLLVLGGVLVRCERHEQALSVYDQASRQAPDSADAWRGLAAVYRFLGRLEDAERAADKAIHLDPADYETIGLRSSLRTWAEHDNHLAALERLEREGIKDWRGAVQVAYAIAREYEDLGRWSEAFAALRRGATLKRQHTRYDHADDLRIFPTLKSAFTREALASLEGGGLCTGEPIFVLGMPRTGSTLVERIITAHSQVQNLGEVSTFSAEMVRLVRERNAAQVDRLALAERSLELPMHTLGARYMAAVDKARDGSARFVDKLPLNCLNVGLIHAALPNAKIVHVVRDPMDACYAIYKYLFRNGYPFSYDLRELGAYYAEYWSLMAHWREVLPRGALYEIRYEDVVEDLPGQARALIDALDLTWEEACIEFHANRQASTTGSAAQVRRPVYRSSVGLWRRYERELAPLREVLAAAGLPV